MNLLPHNFINSAQNIICHPHKTLIITTKGCIDRKFIDYIGGKDAIVYSDICGEPSEEILDNLISNKYNIDTVVGLGGGSILDIAKMYRHLHKISTLALVPTLFGNSSHATNISVINNLQHKKISHKHIEFCPTYVYLDKHFLNYIPTTQMKYQIIDSLAHAIESIDNNTLNPLSQYYCEEAVKILLNDDDFIIGTTYAGLGMSSVGTTLGHTLSYVLSYYGVNHTKAVVTCLPIACEYNNSKYKNNVIKYINNCNFEIPKINIDIKESQEIMLYYNDKLKKNIRNIKSDDITILLEKLQCKISM